MKQCLLQDTSPRCQNTECRRPWTDEFLTDHLPKTWLLKEFKAHREKMLHDVEVARLPEAQEDAVRYRAAKQVVTECQDRVKPIQTEMDALPENETMRAVSHMRDKQAMAVFNHRRGYVWRTPDLTPEMCAAIESGSETAIWNEQNRIYQMYVRAQQRLQNAQTPFVHRIAVIREDTNYTWNNLIVSRFGALPAEHGDGGGAARAQSGWTFTMKCPADACTGFVSQKWECGMCQRRVCKDCHEVCGGATTANDIGSRHGPHEVCSLAAHESAAHVCNPDIKASVAAMSKEAKPCPRCATMISKIDGCDQMWCTQCKTAFSWRTGVIETRVIHNPHYFQYMRTAQTAQTAAPNTVPDGELCLEPEDILHWAMHYNQRRWPLIAEWVQVVGHVRAVEWQPLQRRVQTEEAHDEEQKRQLRVRRLVGEIDDEKWRHFLQRIEKARMKSHRLLEIYDMYVNTALDILRRSMHDDANRDQLCEELANLTTYANEQLTLIRKRFNSTVREIRMARLPEFD